MIKRFVPEHFKAPEKFESHIFILRPLRTNDADKDYKAVMSNIDFLKRMPPPAPEMWKDWPSPNLTIEKEIRDLKWHEDKHNRKEVFSYTLLNPNESECLGCVYLFPGENDYEVLVYYWLTEKAYKEGLNEKLYETLNKWLNESWHFKKITFPGRTSKGVF